MGGLGPGEHEFIEDARSIAHNGEGMNTCTLRHPIARKVVVLAIERVKLVVEPDRKILIWRCSDIDSILEILAKSMSSATE